MQFNTALCFTLIAAALMALQQSRIKAAAGIAALPVLIGMLTLFQYASGVSLGIDQLLMEHHITTETSHPGRMAPNTALSFLVSGGILVVWMWLGSSIRPIAAGIGGSIVASLGAVALIGYMSGVETAYGWSQFTNMALHTSIGFILWGLSLILAFRGRKTNHGRQASLLHIAPFGVGFLALTFSLWLALQNQQAASLQTRVEAEADYIAKRVEEALDTQIEALHRMGDRWDASGGTPKPEWFDDAENYIRQLAVYQAIEYVDANNIVQWIVPLEGNEQAIGLDLGQEANRRRALEIAKQHRTPQVSEPISLVQGGVGFLCYVPLFVDARFDGFVLGVFRFDKLLTAIIPEFDRANFKIELYEGDQVLYASEAGLSPVEFSASNTIKIRNVTWTLRMRMSEAYMTANTSPLPEVVFWVGLIITSLFLSVFYFYDRAKERAAMLEETNLSLQMANRELDQFAYVASHDLKAPLRGIHQLSTWLSEDLGDSLDEKSAKYLDQLKARVIRLQSLLESLLNYARLGRQAVDIKTVDLHRSVMNVAELVSEDEHVDIRIKGILPDIQTDQHILDQVLLNILSNAVKHADKPDVKIEVTNSFTDTAVVLLIEDNGPGIRPEFHEKVFGMFQTLKPRDEIEASGMGLALVQKALALVGATVKIVSDPNIKPGTTIEIYWPRR